jgi:hypothetical protein
MSKQPADQKNEDDMGIYDLLNACVESFRNHYLELARNSAIRRHHPGVINEAVQAADTDRNLTDRYESSLMRADQPSLRTEPEPELSRTNEPVIPDDEQSATAEPDAVPIDDNGEEPEVQPYRFRHHTQFNYEIRLQFQLAAIARLAEQISEGETVSTEELVAAGFGLKAAMDITAKTRLQVEGEQDAPAAGRLRHANVVQARNLQSFAAHNTNFALESFSRESLRIHRSMDVKSGEAYQRAVNKFALRFRMDNQFSFSLASRFNVQTEYFAESDPDNLEQYVTSAGAVAEKGTSQLMATFFDAVDAYLNRAEEQLLSRAEEFFQLAARDLGLSAETVAFARDHVTGTIASFFNRVDSALTALESHFRGEALESPSYDGALRVPALDQYYESPAAKWPSDVAVA